MLVHKPDPIPTTNPIPNKIKPKIKQFLALDGSSRRIAKYAIIPPIGVNKIAKRYHQLLRCFCNPADPKVFPFKVEPHFEQNSLSEVSSFPQLEQNDTNNIERVVIKAL